MAGRKPQRERRAPTPGPDRPARRTDGLALRLLQALLSVLHWRTLVPVVLIMGGGLGLSILMGSGGPPTVPPFGPPGDPAAASARCEASGLDCRLKQICMTTPEATLALAPRREPAADARPTAVRVRPDGVRLELVCPMAVQVDLSDGDLAATLAAQLGPVTALRDFVWENSFHGSPERPRSCLPLDVCFSAAGISGAFSCDGAKFSVISSGRTTFGYGHDFGPFALEMEKSLDDRVEETGLECAITPEALGLYR